MTGVIAFYMILKDDMTSFTIGFKQWSFDFVCALSYNRNR